jgi:hypothetical protein
MVKVERAVMPVKYPDMRLDLRHASRDLADERFHSEAWANASIPTPDKRFPFKEALAYIVDDLDVPNPQTLVGEVLADQTELAMFFDLSRALNALLNRIGSKGTYEDAIASPEWGHVKVAARALAGKLSVDDA